MWLVLSFLGAIFTSLTTIFAKIGIKNVKSNFATFFRTGIVIICCIVMCLINNDFYKIDNITFYNYLFLTLSGLATGGSWLCYYRALKLADVNKIAPIDKSSFILTSILFLIFFFDETTNNGDILTICMTILSMTLMLSGTLLMISKSENKYQKKWLIYAILSAVFAALVSFFIKIGLKGIPSNFGTLYRTIIVLIFSGAIVLIRKEYQGVTQISKKSWLFLSLSGVATGLAWLCEYASLNIQGANPIGVNSIGKLSILLTMLLSYIILKEKFTVKTLCGLALLTIGIIIIIIFSL